jgi:hypothetical protein
MLTTFTSRTGTTFPLNGMSDSLLTPSPSPSGFPSPPLPTVARVERASESERTEIKGLRNLEKRGSASMRRSDACVGSAVRISVGLRWVGGKDAKDGQKRKGKRPETAGTQRRKDRNESWDSRTRGGCLNTLRVLLDVRVQRKRCPDNCTKYVKMSNKGSVARRPG